MTFRLDKYILHSDDCFGCKRCCKFDPDEVQDAPMFTKEQYERASKQFATEDIEFEQRGDVWRVILRDLPDSEKKICPFYDELTANCRVFNYELFDCYTWPFYIMNKDGKVVITLSPDCPVVIGRDIELLKEYAKISVGPRMSAIAKQYPGLITDYNPNTIVLCEIADF